MMKKRTTPAELRQALKKEIAYRKKLEAELREISDRYEALQEQLRKKQEELSGIEEKYKRLTPREREVLTLVVDGQLNKEIAAKTGVTERTVKFHRRQIMDRMQASSLAELVRMAERLQIQYSTYP
jgi:FixJ family two-component response regulator